MEGLSAFLLCSFYLLRSFVAFFNCSFCSSSFSELTVLPALNVAVVVLAAVAVAVAPVPSVVAPFACAP